MLDTCQIDAFVVVVIWLSDDGISSLTGHFNDAADDFMLIIMSLYTIFKLMIKENEIITSSDERKHPLRTISNYISEL